MSNSRVATRGGDSGGQKQAGGKGRAAGMGRVGGMGLRAKFMLVLSGVTAAALIALGLLTSLTTNNFLFGQKQHAGVEIARLAAQIGTVEHNKLLAFQNLKADPGFKGIDVPTPTQADVQREIETALTNAKDWYGNGNLSFSDVLAVRFDCPAVPEISRAGIGPPESSAELIKQWTSIYVPKTGSSVSLPSPGIVMSEYWALYGNGSRQRIYRFKIALDQSFQKATNGTEPANVRVDIAADSVSQVTYRLFWTIGIAVLIAIGVVIAVANWLAGNITRPLDLLISDMKIVARGRLDHETKARSDDEIGMLANEFNRMTGNLKIAQAALVEQEKAEYELSIAREVQRQLLPAEAPTVMGFDCAAFYQGAKAVSGDYFDFIPLGNGLWGFIIADVSGKGIPGSMVMAVTRTIVRLVANKYQHRAADTLKETNRLIAKQIKRGMFVTAFYAILDERTGNLTYASAGHNPMVIYRASTKAYELGTGKGIALGFNEGPVFDKTIQETKTVLNPGDMMVIFTDGFPEAMNAENEEFGEERFYQSIARFGQFDARTCIAKLVEEIGAHRGEAEQSDDLTIIAVRNVAGA
jgi:serine phosphatase RsbU (regulator of sigma subunit)